jgi:hypothetical protein
MAGVRIRWRGVARVAAIVAVGLIALRLLPGLLRAPEPPPLGADVGLPQVEPVRAEAEPRTPIRHRRKPRPGPKLEVVPDQPASKAKIGTKPKRRRPPHRHHDKKPEPAPPAVPEYVPPPAPEPAPAPLPEPAPAPPSAPGDGSEEFAPH